MKFTFKREPVADQAVSVLIPVGPGESWRPLVDHLKPQIRDHGHEFVLAPFGHSIKDQDLADVRILSDEAANYGQALAKGIQAARHPLLFLWPANLAAVEPDLSKFKAQINEVDVVMGCRPGRSWMTRCREGCGLHLWLGLGVADARCPVRLYRRAFLERIPIQSEGRFADVEILAKMNFLNGLMSEVDLPRAAALSKDAVWSADFRRVLFRPRFAAPSLAPTAA